MNPLLANIGGWISTVLTLDSLGPAKIGVGPVGPMVPGTPKLPRVGTPPFVPETGATSPKFPSIPELLNPFGAAAVGGVGAAVGAGAVAATVATGGIYEKVKEDWSKFWQNSVPGLQKFGLSALFLLVLVVLFYIAATGQSPVTAIKEKLS